MKLGKRIEACLKTEYPEIQDDQWVISIAFTGHDAAVAIAKGKEVREVIELERFTNYKNFDFKSRKWRNDGIPVFESSQAILNQVRDYITRHHTDTFDVGIYVDLFKREWPVVSKPLQYLEPFNVKNWYFMTHHLAHAAGAYYQSNFNKALTITFDGASPDGPFNVFTFENDNVKHIQSTNTLLVREYYRFGHALGEIKYTDFNSALVYPGKIMGLAGYGTVQENLIPYFRKVFSIEEPETRYKSLIDNNVITEDQYCKFLHYKEYVRIEHPVKAAMLDEIRIYGKKGRDIAATLQRAFELEFLDIANDVLEEYKDWPLCLSGGAALNIILNTKLIERGHNIFVPPDPSDCGLALGAMLFVLKTRLSTPYLGTNLLDLDMLGTYLNEDIDITDKSDFIILNNIDQDLSRLAQHIGNGKIIGIARGRSEIGPRALGNRSIVCSVAIPDMKDIINAKVKGREHYRPFAPIVRQESVNTYFEWDKESKYMSFSPKVREEYLDKIKPVVHIDGTARVQTITREQNSFIYDLLGEVKKTTGYDILLNTSFNVDGKPIISTIRDAIKVLKDTRLDGIVIENTLILKKDK